MKPKKHLGFSGMRTMLSSCFNQIPEHRQSNKITYSAHDALMSGFACMHFQDPSLLQFQKRLEKKHHKSNLQTLFDIKSIPESTQLRTIIDGVDSDYFSSFFDDYTHYLQRGKHLAQYQLLDGIYTGAGKIHYRRITGAILGMKAIVTFQARIPGLKLL